MSASRLSGPEVEESVQCNLIPMIDIMFLLLLFFMLSADMSTRELEDMELPYADQVIDDKNEKAKDGGTTMVNIHHRGDRQGVSCPVYKAKGTCPDADHWKISIRAREYTPDTIAEFLSVEASLELEDLPPGAPAGTKQLSKRRVMIRADGLAMFGYVQKVLEGCAKAGIYKIELAAARPPV